MRTITVLFQIMLFASLAHITSSCVSNRVLGVENNKPIVIRYGENGVPNFIKGENLSHGLDRDKIFQQLKAKKQYTQIALYYLDRQRELFKLTSAKQEFVVEAVNPDATGQIHIRFKQVFKSIPVWGKELGVHLNSDKQIYYVHGSYQPISSGLKTEAEITDATAADVALRSKDDPGQWRIESVETYIYAPSNDIQHLSYKVNLIHNAINREYCFVDSVDGRILHSVSRTTSAKGISIKSTQ